MPRVVTTEVNPQIQLHVQSNEHVSVRAIDDNSGERWFYVVEFGSVQLFIHQFEAEALAAQLNSAVFELRLRDVPESSDGDSASAGVAGAQAETL